MNASKFIKIVNEGAKLPQREILNYIGKSIETKISGGGVLYGVRDQGSRRVWWSRVRSQGELQWRMDQSVLQEWNQGTHIDILTVPERKALIGFEGPARGQGQYIGGGNQIYIPKVPDEWIVREKWP